MTLTNVMEMPSKKFCWGTTGLDEGTLITLITGTALDPSTETIGSCWAWIHSFVASASTPTGYGSKPSRTLAFTKQQGKSKMA